MGFFFFFAIDEPHSNDPIFVNLFVKLKVVAIDRDLNVIHQSQVHFDSQLPEFGYVNASARHDAHFIEMTLRQVSCRLLIKSSPTRLSNVPYPSQDDIQLI